MENLTQNYCNGSIHYNIDNSLKISLNITENKCNIPVSKLFTMSARENKKRDFLFVSKVIGKHMPMIPGTLKIIGGNFSSSYGLMKERILMIILLMN